jgi:hypothetical protein
MKLGKFAVSRCKYVAARNLFKTVVRFQKLKYRVVLKDKLEKCNSSNHVGEIGAVSTVLKVKNGKHISVNF